MGTDFASFQDILVRKPEPEYQKKAVYNDFKLFEGEIIRKYVDVTLGMIRKEDPDHLIFTTRFNRGGGYLPYLGFYKGFDGIGVNIYPKNFVNGLSAGEIAILKLVHEKTGKPILIGEWSVPSEDSGFYDNSNSPDFSWACLVKTQQERASQAAQVLRDFYNLPFVVGAHWFTWRDIDKKKRRANRGLMTAQRQPWKELWKSLNDVHQELRSHWR